MSLKEKPNWAIKVFYSYTHEDERLRRKLEVHLSAMKRQGLIIGWYDRDISAGTNREQEIDSQLSSVLSI